MKRIALITMGIFLLIGSSLTQAEKAPQAVVEALELDLVKYIGPQLEDRKEDFGFKLEDNIDNMTYSQPFKILIMDPKLLEISGQRKSIDTLKKDLYPNQWYSILFFNGEARGIISISYLRNRFRVTAFSADVIAKDLQQLFRVYSPEKVDVFQEPTFNEHYFHIPHKNKKNLTILTNKLTDLNLKDSISKIKDIVDVQSDIVSVAKKLSSRISERAKQFDGGQN